MGARHGLSDDLFPNGDATAIRHRPVAVPDAVEIRVWTRKRLVLGYQEASARWLWVGRARREDGRVLGVFLGDAETVGFASTDADQRKRCAALSRLIFHPPSGGISFSFD